MEVGRPLSLALAALALVLAAALAAEVVRADDHVDQEEPHVLVRIHNEADEQMQLQVAIDGPEDFSDDVTIPPSEVWEHRHAGPSGTYEVEATYDGEHRRSSASRALETEGCQGPFLAAFAFSGDGVSTRPGGCMGETPGFTNLLAEAREARSASASGEIEIPQPRDESQGRLLLWDELGDPSWEEADEVPFAWLPNATFHDEKGRSVEGHELAYLTPYHLEGWARTPLFQAEASSQNVEDRLRYAAGDRAPVSKTRAVSSGASANPFTASVEILWEIRYGPAPSFLDCLFRNAQQGQPLPAGADTTAPCPALGEEGAWWTGEPATREGFRTVSQYGVDDPEAPSTVVEIVWAEKLPYPLLAETFTDTDSPGEHRIVAKLANLTRAGAPMEPTDAAPAPAAIERGPVAPLAGPELRDDDRVPFSLAEASEAAQQDPTLTELQALLTDDEPILAGAVLVPDRQTDAGEARTLRWTMAYTAPSRGPVLVACQRPTTESSPGLAAPVADCRELDEAPAHAEHLAEVPRVGHQALPGQTATWDTALDRWRLLDPANASASLTLARYDPLAEHTAIRPSEDHLLVGTHGRDPDPGPGGSPEVPTTVSLGLADGHTLTHRTGVKSYAGLTAPADALGGLDAATPGEASIFSEGDPLVGAAGASLLGLLAFGLFALYSRLQDDEVLAHDTRRQIRDLVEAEPGIHASAIARRVDANGRTVEHHLDVLLREDVLTVLERGGYNHHFVQGRHAPKEMQALASLQRGRAEEVYEAVRQDPGMDLSTLANVADISKAYASKLVDQLVDAGLVDRVRDGRSARLYANEIRA